MSFAQSMRYAPLAPVIRSRSLEMECTSDSLAYAPGDVIRINIPSIPRSYVEPESSYLHFNLRNLTTNSVPAPIAANLDGSAYSLFSKVEVYAGTSASTLLESTDNVHVLMSMLFDAHCGADERFGAFSVLAGTSTSTSREGRSLFASNGTNAGNQTFAIPLPSFLGLFGTKAVPISGGFTVFLTLSPATTALVSAAQTDIPGYQVSQCRFVASVIELDPMADAALLKSYGGQALSIPVIRWQSYTSTQPAAQRSNSILIGCSASSVKSIIGTHRVSANLTRADIAHVTQRIRNNMSELQIRAGSALVPPNKVRTESQFFASFLKSRHLLSYTGTQGLLTSANFWLDTANNSAFAFGVDLDVFTGRGDTLSSGINLNGIQTFIDTAYSADPVAALIHIFCELNALILVSPTGEATVAF
jgi:hypothetical protein